MKRKTLLIVPLLVALALAGCTGCASQNPGGTATPSVPEPPQVQVARYCQLGAASAATAANLAIALYNGGQIDAPTFAPIRTYIKVADQVFRDVSAEAASADSWPVMRVRIAGIAVQAATGVAVTDPALKTQIDGIVAQVQQILGVQ